MSSLSQAIEQFQTQLIGAVSQVEMAVEDSDTDIQAAMLHAEIASRAIQTAIVELKGYLSSNAAQKQD